MSAEQTGEQPEPQMDAPPDPAPGGPADRVERDGDDLPPQTPDQPRSAQVEEHQVPDEIEEPDATDEGEKDVDPKDEEPV